jgi:DNA-binding response OmpR family regulator
MSKEVIEDYNCYVYVGEILVQKNVLHELEQFLCYQGGKIYRVTSNAEARAVVENHNIAAIIIDQYLSFSSGLDFMRWIHGFAFIPTIFIVINKYGRVTEMVVALEAGAADAVHADISVRELAARVHACIRKYYYGSREKVLNRYGIDSRTINPSRKTPLYFTPQSNKLYFSDTSRVVLHGKEAELLNLLIYKYPEYIDREEISQSIFRQAWNPHDRRIDNLISRLRKIVDATDNENAESIIETVRNEGYRLRAPIALIPMENPLNSPLGNDGKALRN